MNVFEWRQLYVDNPLDGFDAVKEMFGINIEPVDPELALEAGGYFKIVGVRHLLPQENGGNHHLFMDILDERGEQLRFLSVSWDWEGRYEGQRHDPVFLDKPTNEPSGNIPIGSKQIIWAQPLTAAPAERIDHVHTQVATADGSNTLYHHSFYVLWMFVPYVEEPDPDPDPEPIPDDCEELREYCKTLEAELLRRDIFIDGVRSLLDEFNEGEV